MRASLLNRPLTFMLDSKKTLLAALLALGLAGMAASANAQVAPKIPLDKIQIMFDNMRAQTRWNVDGPLLWGYFFLDADHAKLEAAAAALSDQGYHVVDIAPIDGRDMFRLHVERVERHTPQSLYARDIELEALARKLHIGVYDGMDVGLVPRAPAASAPKP